MLSESIGESGENELTGFNGILFGIGPVILQMVPSCHDCTTVMIANCYLMSMICVESKKKDPQKGLASIEFYAPMEDSAHA